MNRAEAIAVLENGILNGADDTAENNEALDVAIEALKQPEITYCKDCKYLKDGLFCTKHHYSDGGEETIMGMVQSVMFCALGEKR